MYYVFVALFTRALQEMELRIYNDSPQLPLSFSIERIAHFTFTPASGLVLPGMVQAVAVGCLPRQIGTLSRKVDLALADGTITVPLQVCTGCAVMAVFSCV